MLDPTCGVQEFAQLFGAGCVGALGGLCAKGDRFQLPQVLRHTEAGSGFEPGFLGPLVAGGIVGALATCQADFVMLPFTATGPRGLVAAAIGFVWAVLGTAAYATLISPVLRRLAPPPEERRP